MPQEGGIMPILDMPKDPVMLLSFVNTQLRDNYSSITELCHEFGVDVNNVTGKLRNINYVYDEKRNQFV